MTPGGGWWLRVLVVAALASLLVGNARCREITVASYNVENYLSPAPGRAGKTDKQKDAVAGVLRAIRPDVVGLIEMGDAHALSDLQSRLKAVGLDLPYAELVDVPGQDRHLAVLSRFPITERRSERDVPVQGNGALWRVSRGILDVTIQVPGTRPLRLIGVHLKSRLDAPGLDEQSLRAREACAVRARIDEALGIRPDGLLLVFGDLNDTKNSLPVKTISGAQGRSRSMRELPLADKSGERWTQYWAEADVYSRFDFLFASPALWPHVKLKKSGISSNPDWFTASDHRAVFATIDLPSE